MDAPRGLHYEDDYAAVEQAHADMAAIAAELAGIRAALEQLTKTVALVVDEDGALYVRQYGAWIIREDRP